MRRKWINAGGQYLFPFMGVVSRIYEGQYENICPKCQKENIRFYFHIMNKVKRRGTCWVWCNHCGTTYHAPYLDPPKFQDPFEDTDIEKLGYSDEGFYDLVNRLWDERKIGMPQ